MPDADIIYEDVGPGYKGVYKQVCGGQATSEELAHSALSVLKKELKALGDGPYQLISETRRLISAQCGGPLLNQAVDWKHLRRQIDKIAQEISQTKPTNKREMALALDACHSVICEIENGAVIDDDDLEFQTAKTFMIRNYESNFEERVPVVSPQGDVDPEVLTERLAGMRPHIEKRIDYFASSVVRNGSFKSIRMPPRARGTVKPLDLNDDLLNLGVHK